MPWNVRAVVIVICLAVAGFPSPTARSAPTCFDRSPTIVARGNEVQGTAGSDVIVGSSGRDRIYGNGGADFICGAGGGDFLSGGPGDDRLMGERGEDVLVGAKGRDRSFGGPAADRLHDWRGGDRLEGGAGDDWLLTAGPGDDLLLGGAGNDKLGQDSDHDRLRGGDGHDTVDYCTVHDLGGSGGCTDHALRVDLEAGTMTVRKIGNDGFLQGGPGTDRLFAIESVTSGGGKDVLLGNRSDNTLQGDWGHDLVKGRGGDDRLIFSQRARLYGGSGDDQLSFRARVIYGGPGFDVMVGFLPPWEVYPLVVDLARRTAYMPHFDITTELHSVEGTHGSEEDDVLRGDAGLNLILAGPGDDALFGRQGDDQLDGGRGNDSAAGGRGDDRCSSEAAASCEG